mmetsp:Transcript_23335/g.31232  ORF Transcript_23335/g.31232 Transcript_23335/m.31232 type:complete len:277 (-) Transcript_23335:82-912(-)
MTELQKIFTGEDRALLDRLDYFRERRLLEGNPLVRFCTIPDCDGYMIGRSMNDRKLSCPKCSHSICFRCREDWHGYCTSCEDAMEAKFEGWGSGVDRIIFCPMCRTKIQRTEGCNHMTCLFCRYEFCYYCGSEASGSTHWQAGMGCGVGMMDSAGGRVRGKCCQIVMRILRIMGMIVAYPFLVVLGPPVLFAAAFIVTCFRANCCCGCTAVILSPIPFALGLVVDVCWIPVALVMLPTMFIVMLAKDFGRKVRGKRQAMARIRQIIESNERLVNRN